MPKINRNFIFLGVAIVLGVLASFLAVHYVNKQIASQTRQPSEQTLSVVVPVHDMVKGAILQHDDVAARKVPVDFVPSNALTPANYTEYMGQVVNVPLTHGVPIPSGAVGSLADHFSSIIKTGDVAYTIQVNATNSISGLIAPGDRIDLLLLTDGNDRTRIRPLLGNVLVLATGRRASGVRGSKGRDSYSNITLEVSPKNAQRLSVAREVGDLRVLLRPHGDEQAFNLKLLSKADLLNLSHGHRGRGIQFIIGGKG